MSIVQLTDVSKIKEKLIKRANFRHNKTGNTYSHYGQAQPTEFPDGVSADVSFVAFCCENKEVKVTVYTRWGQTFFIPSENPNLSDNLALKVLYERDGKFWLRSVDDFSKLVELNGELKPRFEQLE